MLQIMYLHFFYNITYLRKYFNLLFLQQLIFFNLLFQGDVNKNQLQY